MATVRKRGKGYQIDYFDPNGKRIRKSFKKKKDADVELGKRVSLIAEVRYLDVKKDYTSAIIHFSPRLFWVIFHLHFHSFPRRYWNACAERA